MFSYRLLGTAAGIVIGTLLPLGQQCAALGAEETQDEIIIAFKEKGLVRSSGFESFIGRFDSVFNIEVVGKIEALDAIIVRSKTGERGSALIQRISLAPEVQYAEPNAPVAQQAIVPNDQYYMSAAVCGAATDAVPSDGQWGLRQIGAEDAWTTRKTSPDVVVAVIDSGVQGNHLDFQRTNAGGSNVILTKSVIRDTVRDDQRPATNHGTYVAGILGAVGNNNIGVAGVTWNVKIISIRFIRPSGSGRISDAVTAMLYAIGQPIGNDTIATPAHIINASWGAYAPSSTLQAAVDLAKARNVLIVAAAGNRAVDIDEGRTPFYPATYSALPDSNVISVMASDRADNPLPDSGFGATSVDLAAPGLEICTTKPRLMGGGDYWATNGTSIATPFVTGAAALLKQGNLSATPQQIKMHLRATAHRVPALTGKNASGGRLDLDAALDNSLPQALKRRRRHLDRDAYDGESASGSSRAGEASR
jgi:subtilisin family serine protease